MIRISGIRSVVSGLSILAVCVGACGCVVGLQIGYGSELHTGVLSLLHVQTSDCIFNGNKERHSHVLFHTLPDMNILIDPL